MAPRRGKSSSKGGKSKLKKKKKGGGNATISRETGEDAVKARKAGRVEFTATDEEEDFG